MFRVFVCSLVLTNLKCVLVVPFEGGHVLPRGAFLFSLDARLQPQRQDIPLGVALYPAISLKGRAAFCFGHSVGRPFVPPKICRKFTGNIPLGCCLEALKYVKPTKKTPLLKACRCRCRKPWPV